MLVGVSAEGRSGGHSGRLCVSDTLSCGGGRDVLIMAPASSKDQWVNEASVGPEGGVRQSQGPAGAGHSPSLMGRAQTCTLPCSRKAARVSDRGHVWRCCHTPQPSVLPLWLSPRYPVRPRSRRRLCRAWKSSRSTRFQKRPLKCLTSGMQVAFERCFPDTYHMIIICQVNRFTWGFSKSFKRALTARGGVQNRGVGGQAKARVL